MYFIMYTLRGDFMLRFALCDDNIQILDRLPKMLESIFIRNNIDAEICLATPSSNEILNYVKENCVDVLILDINLKSSLTGCDIADIVRKKNKDVYIMFLTGHLDLRLFYKFLFCWCLNLYQKLVLTS